MVLGTSSCENLRITYSQKFFWRDKLREIVGEVLFSVKSVDYIQGLGVAKLV